MLSIALLFDPQTLDSLCLSASWCKKCYLFTFLRWLLDLTNSIDKQKVLHIRITLWNPVNADTEGDIEIVRINSVSILKAHCP